MVNEGIISDFSQASLERAILTQWNTLCMRMAKTPAVELIETPSQTFMVSESKFPFFNRVFRTRLSEKNVDEAITRTMEFFGSRGVPFHWQTQPDDTPSDLPDRLSKRGFAVDETPGMAIDLRELKAPEPKPGFVVQRVKTPKMLETFCRTMIQGDELPPEVSPAFTAIHTSLGVLDDYRHYIGYYEGKPVATSSVQYADGVAGLYMVSTLREVRGMGFGSLITTAPLIDARNRDYRVGILHSSKMGYNVYLRLGFKEYCTMTGYISKM